MRTCSLIKQQGTHFSAIPFYDKRNNKEYPTPSTVANSWNSHTYSNKGNEHAGMGKEKTLGPYKPELKRSRLESSSFIPPYRNSSVIELGNRSNRDDKHWKSTYRNNFVGKWNVLSSHPGIQAARNKWERHLIAK